MFATPTAADVFLQRLDALGGRRIESQCRILPSAMPRGRCPFVPVRLAGRGGPEHGLALLPTKVCPPLLPCLPVRVCVAGSCAHHRSRVLRRCFETAASAGTACADVSQHVRSRFGRRFIIFSTLPRSLDRAFGRAAATAGPQGGERYSPGIYSSPWSCAAHPPPDTHH